VLQYIPAEQLSGSPPVLLMQQTWPAPPQGAQVALPYKQVLPVKQMGKTPWQHRMPA
jgi:hypothetical protein